MISLRTISFFLTLVIAVLGQVQCHADDSVVGAEDSLRLEFLRFSMENAGVAERGKVLFNHPEKAMCSKCHLLTGMEKSGPNLA